MFYESKQIKPRKFAKFQRFRPLQTALAGGFLLMLSSGIHIGYGFFQWDLVDLSWNSGISSNLVSFCAVSWFMGGIVGFIMTPTILTCIKKQLVYLIANSLVALSAILMILLPQYFYAIFFARLIAGIGHGLGYVAVVEHFGEICEDQVRGRLGTSLHLFILKGGIISGPTIISFFSVEGRMDPNRFLGICSLVLSIGAILMTLVFYKESIVYLIRAEKDDEAIETLLLLRGQREETAEITESFNELKMMVIEDKDKGPGIFSDGNLKPLIVVTLVRIAFVLSFNYAMKYLHFFMTHNTGSIDYTFILNIIHTSCVFAVMFTIDKGRRKHFFLSAVGTSAILIIFGGLRTSIYANSNLLIFIMLVAFEFFSAIGLGLTSHIYSTELFPISKKTSSIAFTSTIEHCIQIAFFIRVGNHHPSFDDAAFLFTSGVLLAAITIFLFFNLPETKCVTLRQAKNKSW